MQVTQVPYTLFLILTIAVVVSVIVQGAVFLGLYLVARTAVAKGEKIAADATAKALPILTQTRAILEDLSPKIRSISSNLAEISATVRDQTRHVNTTVGDVVDKTRHQADRVDEMVSAVLNGVTHASETIRTNVTKPVRQVNGVYQGFRAAFEHLVSASRKGSGARPTASYPPGAAPSDYREAPTRRAVVTSIDDL